MLARLVGVILLWQKVQLPFAPFVEDWIITSLNQYELQQPEAADDAEGAGDVW